MQDTLQPDPAELKPLEEEPNIFGSKEDELIEYSQDEVAFQLRTIPKIRQRGDRMIEIPLPLKETSPAFPNRRGMAYKRTKETLNKMRKNPVVFKSSLDKFATNIDKDYPRFVPVPRHMQHNKDGLAYWIPLFSVWQKGKARIVFDSRASTKGICLNDALYQGPDRNNSLRRVLLCNRKQPWAVIADIENMFHQIAIPEEQSTYLRFFWYN